MIVFIPQGGLCNRMRSIDAAIGLSVVANTELVIQWHKDPGLNAEFDELFKIPDKIHKLVTINYNGFLAQLRKSVRKRLYRVTFDQYFSEKDLMQFIVKGGDLVKLANQKSICITACNRFLDVKPYYEHLEVNSETLNIAKSVIPDPSGIIGVHLRRTDHKVAIARSPLVLFVKAMKQEVQNDNKVRFFVATDSIDTENELTSIFPGRIIVHKKSTYNRANVSAIRDALIDLNCLSRTSKIIGSYSSSFSEEAANIGGVDLVVMDNDIFTK